MCPQFYVPCSPSSDFTLFCFNNLCKAQATSRLVEHTKTNIPSCDILLQDWKIRVTAINKSLLNNVNYNRQYYLRNQAHTVNLEQIPGQVFWSTELGALPLISSYFSYRVIAPGFRSHQVRGDLGDELRQTHSGKRTCIVPPKGRADLGSRKLIKDISQSFSFYCALKISQDGFENLGFI